MLPYVYRRENSRQTNGVWRWRRRKNQKRQVMRETKIACARHFIYWFSIISFVFRLVWSNLFNSLVILIGKIKRYRKKANSKWDELFRISWISSIRLNGAHTHTRAHCLQVGRVTTWCELALYCKTLSTVFNIFFYIFGIPLTWFWPINALIRLKRFFSFESKSEKKNCRLLFCHIHAHDSLRSLQWHWMGTSLAFFAKKSNFNECHHPVSSKTERPSRS